jgi:LacI family transcriptional regulator
LSSTYKDIKRLTGLSLSTISKYFNGGNVRPQSRQAIEAAARKLDFRINDFARGLKSGRSMSVGVLIPELDSSFHTTIMRQVGQFLRRRGYSCLVCECNADKSVERDALSFLIDKRVDGIITIPLDSSGSHLELARARKVPVVLVDRKATAFETDAVLIDNFSAGEMAAGFFMQRGHKKAAIICGPSGVYTMGERRRGFVQAFNNRFPDADVRALEVDFSIEGGYNAAKGLLKSDCDITGVFCSNYELTLGALTAMNELEVKYPEDISLIGFDSIGLSKVMNPPLTLVEQPMAEIAKMAASLLLKRLEERESEEEKGSQQIRTITLAAKLTEGKSVAVL